MKLQYLGTAAAEGIPGLFCQCENTLYDDLSPIAEEEGFIVSYDGMTLFL